MWFRKYICLRELNKHISIGSGGLVQKRVVCIDLEGA